MDGSGLTSAEQNELSRRLEAKQMKQFLSAYQTFVQKCFDDCISDFSSKSLSSREEGCVMKCIEKQMKGSERIGLRFQEMNAQMSQSGLPGR